VYCERSGFAAVGRWAFGEKGWRCLAKRITKLRSTEYIVTEYGALRLRECELYALCSLQPSRLYGVHTVGNVRSNERLRQSYHNTMRSANTAKSDIFYSVWIGMLPEQLVLLS
jgi:hypothetical protein